MQRGASKSNLVLLMVLSNFEMLFGKLHEPSETDRISNAIYRSFFPYCDDTGLDVETWSMINKIEEII